MFLQTFVAVLLAWCSSAAAQGFPGGFFLPPPQPPPQIPIKPFLGNCDVTLNDPKGSFQSPLYPSTYPGSLDCQYSIEVEKGHRIEIIFHDFAVDIPALYQITKERADYVLILDGDQDESEGTIFHFSEPSLQFGPPHTFVSQSNSVVVIFRTDLVAGDRGFNATYKSLSPDFCWQWDLFKLPYIKSDDFSCREEDTLRKDYFKTCKISCKKNYRMIGSSKLTCKNGAFTPAKPCGLIRWLVHTCDSTNMRYCPYSRAEVAEFLSENLQDSKDLTEKELRELGLDRLPKNNVTTTNASESDRIPGKEEVLSRFLGTGTKTIKVACFDKNLNFSYCKKRGNSNFYLFKCSIIFRMQKLDKAEADLRFDACFRCRELKCSRAINYV